MGAIETEFGGGAVHDNAELNSSITAQTALGRVGLPDDIGGVIAALLSDATAGSMGSVSKCRVACFFDLTRVQISAEL